MNPITNLLTNISNKPAISFTICQSAAGMAFLSWLHIVTPILGFISALFGIIVGAHSIYTLFFKKKKKHVIIPKFGK